MDKTAQFYIHATSKESDGTSYVVIAADAQSASVLSLPKNFTRELFECRAKAVFDALERFSK